MMSGVPSSNTSRAPTTSLNGGSSTPSSAASSRNLRNPVSARTTPATLLRSEEHTSELQSLMRISYAVFCLKKKTNKTHNDIKYTHKPQVPHISNASILT